MKSRTEHLRPALLGRAKVAGLNVSRLASAALAAELERRTKVVELDSYLADLDAELGPVPQQESVAAHEWADQVLPARSGGAKAAREACRSSWMLAASARWPASAPCESVPMRGRGIQPRPWSSANGLTLYASLAALIMMIGAFITLGFATEITTEIATDWIPASARVRRLQVASDPH